MKFSIDLFARCILASGASLMFSSTAAQAEEFDGPYAGVEAGYAVTDVDGVTIAGPFELKEKSTVISAVAGYRLPLGPGSRVVLGVEGSIGTYTSRADARYGVSGTAGYRIVDKGLLYGRVGYAWLDGVDSNLGDGLHGLVLGGGYEHRLTDRIGVRAEYRYIDWRGGVGVPDNASYFEGQEITAALVYDF
jgi:outer membrane immunogenic protein